MFEVSRLTKYDSGHLTSAASDQELIKGLGASGSGKQVVLYKLVAGKSSAGVVALHSATSGADIRLEVHCAAGETVTLPFDGEPWARFTPDASVYLTTTGTGTAWVSIYVALEEIG